MGLYEVLALAVAMSADAFSFSLGLGMLGVTRRQVILLSLTVLVFHILMPLTGYYAGGFIGSFLGRWAAGLGALVLILLGLRMVWNGIMGKSEDGFSGYILTSAYGIVVLSATVSLDALSVGFTLGIQGAAIGPAVVAMGIMSGLATFLGLGFGQRMGEWIGHRAVLIGGLILVFIGAKMFV